MDTKVDFAFTMFDDDGNGFLSMDELLAILKVLTAQSLCFYLHIFDDTDTLSILFASEL